MVKKRTGISFTIQPSNSWPSAAALLLSGKADLALLATDWALTYNEKASAKDKLRFLATFGAKRAPELPNVPLASELLSPEDKQVLELVTMGTAVGRPFAAPPGTPPARVQILRRAFDAALKDPALIEEGRTIQAEISPTPGEEVQKIIGRLYATPKPVVERAKKLLEPSAK